MIAGPVAFPAVPEVSGLGGAFLALVSKLFVPEGKGGGKDAIFLSLTFELRAH